MEACLEYDHLGNVASNQGKPHPVFFQLILRIEIVHMRQLRHGKIFVQVHEPENFLVIPSPAPNQSDGSSFLVPEERPVSGSGIVVTVAYALYRSYAGL